MSKWDYKWWDSIEEDWTSPYENSSDSVKFTYWWEDMRPKEVNRLVKDAYEAGYEHGDSDARDYFEQKMEETIQNKIDELKAEIFHLEAELANKDW